MLPNTREALGQCTSHGSPAQPALYRQLIHFLTTRNFAPLIPTSSAVESGDKPVISPERTSYTYSPRSAASESSDYEPLQLRYPPKKPMLGYKLNLGNSAVVAPNRKSSARSLVTARTEKQHKIDTYAPIMSKVVDYIYLSGIEPASSAYTLRQNSVTYVLNLCGDIYNEPALPEIRNFVIYLKDASWESVEAIFYTCFVFIHDARSKGENVLVHCQQGVSRSASIVIAYLMLTNDLTYEEAYAHVRVIRPIIAPNPGFIFQLCDWWRMRHCCIFCQQRCSLQKQRFAASGIVQLQQAISKDSAIRDLYGSHFIYCVKSNQRYVQPRVYRFTIFSDTHYLWLLKKEDTKIIDQQKQYVFDPRFIFVVTNLAIGTVIIIGDQALKYAQRCGKQAHREQGALATTVDRLACYSDVRQLLSAKERAAQLQSEQQDAQVSKFDGPQEALGENARRLFFKEDGQMVQHYLCSPIDMDEFLYYYGHTMQTKEMCDYLRAIGLCREIEMNIELRLAEIEFFEQISTHLTVFYQRGLQNIVNSMLEQKAVPYDAGKAMYLLSKLNIIKKEYRIYNDYIEDPSSELDAYHLQQLMRMNPDNAKWELSGSVEAQDLKEITIFYILRELDQEFALIYEKALKWEAG